MGWGSEMPDDKVAVADIEWSDDYQGGDASGYYGGNGNEKYNFKPFRGTFRAYIPPTGKNFPRPSDLDGWTVFFVARHPVKKRMFVVGWYQDATFLPAESRSRPDARHLGSTPEGGDYTFSLSSKDATLVPALARRKPIPKGYIHRSFAYLRGNGARRDKEKVAKWLLRFRDKAVRGGFQTEPEEERPRLGFCGDPTRRREIELAAEQAVIDAMPGWEHDRLSDEKVGYDLRFWKKNGEEVHVEVKGTSLDLPHFFISQRELDYGLDLSKNDNRSRRNKHGNFRPLWKLAVVHNIDTSKDVQFFKYREIEKAFDLRPYALQGTWKKSA